ncbi:MAG TPA: HAMP domain-containing sensor histidine kinase [Solirubrobacteraceae bacterium]|nr:HAMP domain-containing sensor histidine kinase [Solirubrobacteraceae bacterium]
MSFRRRITIVSATAVAIAVVLAAILTYVLTSDQLHNHVDTQLRDKAAAAARRLHALEATGRGGLAFQRRAKLRAAVEKALAGPLPAHSASASAAGAGAGGAPTAKPRTAKAHAGEARTARSPTHDLFGALQPSPDEVRGYQQIVDASGRIVERAPLGAIVLPVEARTRALAAHGGEPFLRDADVHGVHLRVLAAPLGRAHAVQFAQPLAEVDSLLARLRLILALLVVGGVALAALLGRLVAGAAVQPLKRLTRATEHVAHTQDLSKRIRPSGEDEIGRLATSFNAMLDALQRSMSALDASVHAQRQLVADASHELRTPITSLRTNIEILQQQVAEMDPEDSRRLLADVVEQIEDLTTLMNDLIDLARGEEPRAGAEELRLDLLVAEVIERTRRRSPATPLATELEPTILTGVPARLERAVGNLIDNAVKYSPPGRPVEVALRAGELTVRDHGPGIAEEDMPHVFDRFYRGAEARGLPGSGLGLAIVRQVALQHGGDVRAQRAPGGGTLMRLRLAGTERPDLRDVQSERDAAALAPAGARA